MYLVISSSLKPSSRSRLVARTVYDRWVQQQIDCQWIDLQEMTLPPCDATSCYADPNVQTVTDQIKSAKGILLATPIYNYYACSSAKNLVELTGQAWRKKVVGFACAAGGRGSYMSIMSLAGSLMLDFRSFIIPQFVYVTEEHFSGQEISDDDTLVRIANLAKELVRVGDALHQPGEG